MLRAAIFDLDGLLIDSEPLWQRAEIEVFGTLGLDLTREQAQETLGLRSDEVVERRFSEWPWDRDRDPLDEVEARIIRRVIELIDSEGNPKEGVHQALELLEVRGLRLALASSSRMVVIEAALKSLGLRERFEVVYSAEVEPHGKPHPGVYLSTAQRLGVAPSECVALEDSPAGLESARRAGMLCIAVPDPSAVGHPAFAGAELVLASLAELDESVWERLAGSS